MDNRIKKLALIFVMIWGSTCLAESKLSYNELIAFSEKYIGKEVSFTCLFYKYQAGKDNIRARCDDVLITSSCELKTNKKICLNVPSEHTELKKSLIELNQENTTLYVRISGRLKDSKNLIIKEVVKCKDVEC